MRSSSVGGASSRRPGASWHEPGHVPPHAGPSHGPQAPTGLLSRSRREPDPAPSTRRSLQAQVKAHAGEVERLTSFQQDVIAQAGRVQQRLNLAREELATRQEAPEVRPTGLRQAEEQVSLLAWRHRNMGERQQQAAQMLRDAEEHLAMAQERLSALGTPSIRSPSTPALTPPESPTASMPGSPARPVVPAPGTNLRSLSNTSSARQAAADMELLVDALGGEGAAVARLAERAGRRTPRTLAGWLQRPFAKGAPKPLEGKRQDAFMQLVHSDVMKVAGHGEIPPLQAADLMLEAVECTALGANLTPPDREHLLASLRQLREELAASQARQPQSGQGTLGAA